ncbi:MAG: hypothetical protein WAU88_13795 [Candidatus Zixiibacteriota bacterium]
MKRISPIVLLAFLILCWSALAIGGTPSILVKYVSAESIYLSSGKADGLNVGDRLVVKSARDCQTEVEVVFVADHSASCRIVSGTCQIAVGDKAQIISQVVTDTVQTPVDSSASAAKKDTVVTAPAVAKKKGSPTKLSGTLAVMYYNWADRSSSNLDFSQTTARFNIRARRLFDKDITFNFRSRGRYDQRQRTYTSSVGQNAWENRIWEFSISYEDPNASTNFSVGRLLPRRLGSAGYLDGMLVEQRLSQGFRAGLFAGSEPHWAYNEAGLALTKAGGYFSYNNGEPGHNFFEQSLAFIGQYHASNISREMIASEGRYNAGNGWGYYHTMEFDLNRGWRMDRTGQSLSMSSLYVGSYVRLTPQLRLALTYDNRKNYWTYDTRSVVDSLFDDHLRQGIRSQLDITMPLAIQTSFSYGISKRAGESSTTRSLSGYASRYGFLRKTMLVMAQYMSFKGPQENGENYSIRMTDNVASHIQMGLAYGVYNYKVVAEDTHRSNNWFEISSFLDLSRRYFLNSSAEFDSGDDIKGTRLQAEFGCRF